jgi:uncharacterized membrane protein YbhN (UPF0104 family)
LKLSENKYFKQLLKLLISLIAVIYLFHKININELKQIKTANYNILLIPLALMPLNWLIESLKWKISLKNIYNISFKNAVKSVLAGITTSIFTPNRIGEFIGRLSFIPSNKLAQATASEIINSVTQSVTTVVAGVVAFVLFPNFIQTAIPDIKINTNKILIITTILLLIIMFLISVFKKKQVKKFVKTLQNFKTSALLKITALSIIRFLIFLIQFFIILKFLQTETNIFLSSAALSIFYFLMMFLPVLTIAEPGLRISIAIITFPFFGIPETIASVSVSLLWLINIAIPVLVGAILFSVRNNTTT